LGCFSDEQADRLLNLAFLSSSTVAANILKSVVTEKIHPRHGDFQS